VIASRAQTLPVHYLEPAELREQFVAFAEDAALALEQLHLQAQRLGDRHGAAIVPERRVISLRRVVMQNDEVADMLKFATRLPIVFVDIHLTAGSAGEKRNQASDCGLNQMYAGRFKGLEKAAGQTDRDAIAAPCLPADSGHESKGARRGQRLSVEMA